MKKLLPKVSKSVDKSNEFKQLIDIAEKSNHNMVDFFTRSQKEICKTTCINYANEQFGQVTSALKMGENIDNSDNVSKYIVSKEIVDLYKCIDVDNDDG